MEKEYKDSIAKCKPLFEKWLTNEAYELEARIFFASKEEAEAKKVPAGIPTDCFISLVKEYEKTDGQVPVICSTDYSLKGYRYTQIDSRLPSDLTQIDSQDKEDKFIVIEKILIDRFDFYIPEWGVGYRINLKKESPVKDPPPFRKECVDYSRKKFRKSWEKKGMMTDFTLVEDSNKIQTNEVELELQRNKFSPSIESFFDQLFQLLEEAKRVKAATAKKVCVQVVGSTV